MFLRTPTARLDVEDAINFNSSFIPVTNNVAGAIIDGRNGVSLESLQLARGGVTPTAVALKMTQGLRYGTKEISFVRIGVAWPGSTTLDLYPSLVIDDTLIVKHVPFKIAAMTHVPFSMDSAKQSRSEFGVSGFDLGAVSRNQCARKRWGWIHKRSGANVLPERITKSHSRHGTTAQPVVFGEKLHVNQRPQYTVIAPNGMLQCALCGKIEHTSTFFTTGCGAGGGPSRKRSRYAAVC